YSPGIIPVKRPDDLTWIPVRHGSPVYAAPADPAQQIAGDRTATRQARYAGYGVFEIVGPGLIRMLVNVALHGPPFPAKGERVVANYLVHHVVNDPGGASRNISSRRPLIVRELGEVIPKGEFGKGVISGGPRYLRQLSHKGEIHRP